MPEMSEVYATKVYDKVDPIRFEVFMRTFEALFSQICHSDMNLPAYDTGKVWERETAKMVANIAEDFMQAALDKMEGLEIIQRSTPLPDPNYLKFMQVTDSSHNAKGE